MDFDNDIIIKETSNEISFIKTEECSNIKEEIFLGTSNDAEQSPGYYDKIKFSDQIVSKYDLFWNQK